MSDAHIIKLCECAYDDFNTFMIWYEDEQGRNRVFTQDNKIVCFYSEDSAKEKLAELGLNYNGTEMFDIERLDFWCVNGMPSQVRLNFSDDIDCEFLLDFWNLFDDIFYSLGEVFEPEPTALSRECYDKLFFGTDIEAIDQKGEAPAFSEEELRFIRTLMKHGVDFLTRNSRVI